MRFRQGQLLELAGVSRDALRYWKEHLAPLRGKDGRSTGYDFEEVVTVAVIGDLVAAFGISVDKLAPIAPELFDAVANEIRSGRFRSLVLAPSGVEVAEGRQAAFPNHGLILSIRTVVDRIRSSVARIGGEMHSETRGAQLDLAI